MSDPAANEGRKLLSDRPRLLAIFLRLEGTIEILAFFAMLMPQSWMAATHRWLGMGEFPASPLLDYMIRSVSFLYGLHGVLLWFLAADVTRYRVLILFSAASYLLAAIVFTGIDLANHMPWWWTLNEVGSVVFLGLIMFWLARK